MHDFCICADNTVESKVSTVLLKHPGFNCKCSNALSVRMFTFVSSEQEPLVQWHFEKPYAAATIMAVCNTLFAGAAVRRL